MPSDDRTTEEVAINTRSFEENEKGVGMGSTKWEAPEDYVDPRPAVDPTKLAISFNGTLAGVGFNCGYGYAAQEIIEAWQRLKIPVWWSKGDCPIAFSMGQPWGYNWQKPTQYRIGYTAWESTKIPEGWLMGMHEMDEIWATSQACKEWYQDSGVKNVTKVLPHGINSTAWPLTKRTIKRDQPFTFLHHGAEAARKGGDVAYTAFKEAFGDDPHVRLIIKGWPDFKVTGGNVEVLNAYVEQDDLLKIYQRAHAFLGCSRGEGFGMPAFQAAATGMPTLATAWGGQLEYIKYCWPLKYTLINAQFEPHIGCGKWAEPDIPDLITWMQYFADSPNYFFSHAFTRGKRIHKEMTWDIVAKKSIDWLQEIFQSRCG